MEAAKSPAGAFSSWDEVVVTLPANKGSVAPPANLKYFSGRAGG